MICESNMNGKNRPGEERKQPSKHDLWSGGPSLSTAQLSQQLRERLRHRIADKKRERERLHTPSIADRERGLDHT